MIAARAGLENALQSFLYSNLICKPKILSYSTVRGDSNGPGSLAADVKEVLSGAMDWVNGVAGESSGDLGEILLSALELFE